MGCFNKVGFYSHLPITYGNNIVSFICASFKGKMYDDTPIAPFGILSPICLPILGKYNDYGSIEDINHDNNVEFIENCLELSIENIIKAISTCSYMSLNEVKSNERLNSELFKNDSENYILILNKLKNNFKSLYYNYDDEFSLVMTMELLDVYNFVCTEYKNDRSQELLTSIINYMKDNEVEYTNIFKNHSFSDYDNLVLKSLENNDEESAKILLARIKKFNNLKKLIFEYSRSNFFTHCSINSLLIYDLGEFDFQKSFELINNFSNFCYCLTVNCINFTVSNYGNQDILKECNSLIKIHKEFIRILKEKKKEYNH